MPYRAAAKAALDAWRAAHARLDAAAPDSPEWAQAASDTEAARLAYQEAFDAARRLHLPEPPEFDEVATED